MNQDCSCEDPQAGDVQNTRDAAGSSCKPCFVKSMTMTLVILGGVALLVVVLSQVARSEPIGARSNEKAVEGENNVVVLSSEEI